MRVTRASCAIGAICAIGVVIDAGGCSTPSSWRVDHARAESSRHVPWRPADRTGPFLAVRTEPWTRIELDGERVGGSPMVLGLPPPGRHALRFRGAYGLDVTHEIVVEAGRNLQLHYVFTDAPLVRMDVDEIFAEPPAPPPPPPPPPPSPPPRPTWALAEPPPERDMGPRRVADVWSMDGVRPADPREALLADIVASGVVERVRGCDRTPGRAVARFTIDADGRAHDIHVDAAPEIAACVGEAVAGATFEPRDSAVDVIVPLPVGPLPRSGKRVDPK